MFQSLVSFQYWTFIAQILNLFIQIFLFKKFLFKPIQNILEKRRQEVGDLYTQAEEAKADAQQDKAEYEARLLAAEEEAAGIMKNALDRANVRSDEIIREASQKAAAMKEKADRDIAQERKKAVNEIKDDISNMAVEIAEKIVGREVSSQDHEKLISDFIDNMGEQV